MGYAERILALRRSMAEKGCDVFLVSEVSNILYLTGFPGGLLLLPLEAEAVLFAPPLDYLGAQEEAVGCRVEKVQMGERALSLAAREISQVRAKRSWYDALTAESHTTLAFQLGNTALEQAAKQVWALRQVKDDDELRKLREACRIAVHGMAAAAEMVAVGATELQVAAEAEYEMRTGGSEGVAFETLVSSGARSAMPHAKASKKTIQEGEFVIVDLGATVEGYRSDLTRTFRTGKPSERELSIARTVLDAERAAKGLVKDGAGCAQVDASSRAVIEEAGFAESFVHGLGHGVGLDVHEPPRLSPESKETLRHGNVVTIEPGIYIPAFGGFRNEDMVLVLKNGYESLTEAAPVPFL